VTEERKDEGIRPVVRISREPAVQMSGPMGTAIISRVPCFRVERADPRVSAFCTISHLAEKLADCGMSEAEIRAAVERAVGLEDSGDFIELDVR